MTRPLAATARAALAYARARLTAGGDGEHEMAVNRLVFGQMILGYLLVADAATLVVALGGVYAAFGVAIFAQMLARPGASSMRRRLARFVDLGLLSFALHVGGEDTAVLYVFYLWIIFGNGFRFGVRDMRAATAIGAVGFALTIAFTPFWRDHLPLSVGLLLAVVALPAYAATLIRKLSRARVAAEEASRAKSLFLASVSHELRTPLNAVIGMTDLLEGTELDAEQRDMASTAGQSGRSLLALIDDLLNFSRLEAGRMPKNAVAFDLHDLLADARGMLTAQARAKNLRLGLHVSPRTPYRLKGEARQIRDVLVNLLGNAVKFTEAGGVVASVDLVGGEADRPRLRFEVGDTGIGIAGDALSRIFERFTQADETILNSHGGTGLGLAICRQLVEAQGGRIHVESEPGVGSVFWFELDLELDIDVDAAAAPRAPAALVVALAACDERAAALAGALAAAGVTAAPAVGLRDAMRVLRAAGGGAAARRVVVIDAEGLTSDGEGLAAAVRAADADDAVEVVLIDPALADGAAEMDLKLICASASPTLPPPPQLAAMVRIAGMGAVGRRRAPQRADEATTAVRRLNILVAEDNRINQKVTAKILERAGHTVRIADNGELALDALTERTFDIVLMDVNMPVLDGVECAKLYRFASIGKPRTPIVALTADATREARARCAEAGMDACLTKPIDPERLLATIAAIVGDGGAGAATREADAAPGDEVDDEIVASIARHPGFRPARRAVVDRRTLNELEELGGRAFLHELADAFIGDAADVLKTLHEAVRRGEASVFREQTHALRSGAANIGARGIYELCLSYRNMDARDLAVHGTERVRQIEAEFERVRKTLRSRFPEPGLRGGGEA